MAPINNKNMHHIAVSSVQDAKGFLLSHFLISIYGLSRLGSWQFNFSVLKQWGILIFCNNLIGDNVKYCLLSTFLFGAIDGFVKPQIKKKIGLLSSLCFGNL